MLASILCSREYSAYTERKMRECEGYLSLIVYIEKMIASYLAPLSVIFRDFECEALTLNGFLPSVRSGKSPSLAIRESKLLIPDDMRDMLCEYFDGFGKEYKDAELARTRTLRSRLESEVKEERERLDKSVKVTRALLLGAAAGIAILII